MEEIHDLSVDDQRQLMKEIALCSGAIKHYYDVDKINVGAIGCVCRQLHVHVLGRKEGDIVWPKPVWGATDPVKYEAGAADEAPSSTAAREPRDPLDRPAVELRGRSARLESSAARAAAGHDDLRRGLARAAGG